MRRYFLFLAVLSAVMLESGVVPEAFAFGERSFRRAKEYESSLPARMVRKVALPEGYHEGLLLKDGAVWVSNGRGGKILVVDLASGGVISQLDPPATFTEAATEVPGGKYWVTDWDTRKMYLVRIERDRMVPESEVSFAPARPAGIVWDGAYLYVITWRRGLGTKYHLLKMGADGKIVGKVRIRGIEEPSQLAWDGKDLWISSWLSRRVYRIDRNSFEIKGSFTTHIERTTGIAWDGASFWVTGTAAGLYQIELIPHEK